MLVTLDTSCVINLLGAATESPSAAVVELLRAALEGRIRLAVTSVVDDEIPHTAAKAHLRARVAALPVLRVAREREAEREALSARIFADLWPNAMAGSNASAHGLRDARHIATHMLCGGSLFVTLDDASARKAARAASLQGIAVVLPHDAIGRVRLAAPSTPSVPRLDDLVVRAARPDDAQAITELMTPIRDLYPQFDAWRESALQKKRSFVGCIDGHVAAIAVWEEKEKGSGVVKLSTFFVRDEDRGRAVGPHVLFHQLRLWARARTKKVFVTASNRVGYVVPFFISHGFRIEGVSPRRYGTDDVEIVLAKHFVYDDDRPLDAASWRPHMREMLCETPELFHLDPRAWFMAPASAEARRAQFDGLSVPELEHMFFPVRIPTPGRRAYLIPIQPRWADRMLQYRKSQTELLFGVEKLLLRTDNAYYRTGQSFSPGELEGQHVLFYVSQHAGLIAGAARVLECVLDVPEELYLRYGDLGIYQLEDVRKHVAKRGSREGKAMALRFGWWLPFERPIPLDRMRQLNLLPPQTVTKVDFGQFLALCREGGEKA